VADEQCSRCWPFGMHMEGRIKEKICETEELFAGLLKYCLRGTYVNQSAMAVHLDPVGVTIEIRARLLSSWYPAWFLHSMIPVHLESDWTIKQIDLNLGFGLPTSFSKLK